MAAGVGALEVATGQWGGADVDRVAKPEPRRFGGETGESATRKQGVLACVSGVRSDHKIALGVGDWLVAPDLRDQTTSMTAECQDSR